MCRYDVHNPYSSATSSDPPERTFDNPSAGQNLKAFYVCIPFYNFRCDTRMLFYPSGRRSGTGSDQYEPEKITGKIFQQPLCALPVLNICRDDKGTGDKSRCISDDTALATRYQFSAVVSPDAGNFSGFN